MDNPLINDQKQTLLLVSEENLLAIAEITAARLVKEMKARKWVKPEEAEELLNLKRQSIIKLWERHEIDITWVGDEGSRKWLADRQSIEDYLERKRNYNGPGTPGYKPRKIREFKKSVK